MGGSAFANGFLVSGGFTETVAGSTIRPGTIGGNDLVVNTYNSNDKLIINPSITNFNSSTVGGFTKTGAGLVQLNGANVYNGLTAVNQGTVQATNASSLGFGGPVGSTAITVGQTTVASGATLDLQAASSLTIDEPVVLNGGTLTNSGAGVSTLDNGIAGIKLSNLEAAERPLRAASPSTVPGQAPERQSLSPAELSPA